MAKHYRKNERAGATGKITRMKAALIFLAVAFCVFLLALSNRGKYSDSAAPENAPEVAAEAPAPEAEAPSREVVVVPADEGLPAAAESEPKTQKATRDDKGSGTRPLLAILVDDGGSQIELTKRVDALGIPTTWAIIPYRPHSKETLALAASKRRPCILHLPMQAQVDKDSESGKFIIGRGMSAESVRERTEKALDTLPGVVGLNNHRGSRATESLSLMEPLMEVLKKRGLVFVDSRTTAKSVAYSAALKAGVPALQNRGFLDNSADKKEIAKRFDELLRLARKRGALLIICHFRPATVAFLEELNSRYASLPVRFVTVPEMLALTDNGEPLGK